MKSDRSRIGVIYISGMAMRDPEDCAWMFEGVVVLWADRRINTDAVEYLLWSMQFDKIHKGGIPPVYEAHRESGKTIWKRSF